MPDAGRIQRAVDSLIHRGPDQQGAFRSKAVSLGVTRLKIIDLNTGDQPIIADGADTAIVFNGEIYNHADLRRELEHKGHVFRTHSDTETVLHAFLEWDTQCFTRLRGMFAVALWTESAKRLVLARDPMGIKPLYVAHHGGDIFFGSELKALFVHPEVGRQLSRAGLDCYLSLNYVPCPWTLVEGIEKVPPGCWLEWRDGVVRSGSYWELPFGVQPKRDFQSSVLELDSLLQQSLREHLLSDVPLGVWLSGGVDSSTILHYAANVSSSRLKTFSISFQGRSFDETNYIRQVSAQYGTEHEEFDLSVAAGLPDAIEEFAYYSDEPSADAGALPVWFLSKLTRKTATVVLSGEGADELFGGYLTYRANRIAHSVRRLPHSILRLGLRAANLLPVSDEKISFEYKVKRFLEGCLMPPERAHVHWNGAFSESEKDAIEEKRPAALLGLLKELKARLGYADFLAPYLWFDQKYYLADDILTKSDRVSMAHSLEVRPPFLDHRIVEFAAALPERFKIAGSRQKVILKELMRGKLPSSILNRGKIGFDIPAHEWLRGPLRPLLLDTLSDGAAEHAGLFRLGGIEACLRRHLDRRANLGYHLWGLMTLFLWMRRWRIQTTALFDLPQPVPESVLTSI